MGRAKIGIVVGGVLIASALGVYGCSHVHLVKKDKSSSRVTTQATENRGIEIEGTVPIFDETEVVLQKDETTTTMVGTEPNVETAETTSPTEIETTTATTIPAETTSENNVPVADEGMTQIEIPELTSAEQSSVGIVVDKCAFLESNNQVVFSVKIKLPVGAKDVVVDYYCTYSTFSSLEINDELTVIYQSIENGRIAILSANRA